MAAKIVEALIDYDDDSINLSINLDSSNDDSMKKSAVLICVFMLIRVFSIARDKNLKRNMMEVFSGGEDSIKAFIPTMLSQYSGYYKCNSPTIEYGAADIKKRGFLVHLEFEQDWYKPRFRPKGFGLLGKNVDFSAFLMVALIYDRITSEYDDNWDLIDSLNKGMDHALSALKMKGGSLSAVEAAKFTLSIVDVVTRDQL